MRPSALLVGVTLTTSAVADEPRQRELENLLTAARCPTVAATAADLDSFRATDELAPFGLSVSGFLSDAFGVPEAVALLGTPNRCLRSPSMFVAYSLATRAPEHRSITLQIYDQALVGVVVNLARPIDAATLVDRFGPMRWAGDLATATIVSAAFRGQLRIRRDRTDASKVATVVFERTPLIEILPDRFTTADDVARLVALVLAPRAPDPVRFYGSLGIRDDDHSTADRVSLLPSRNRNIARASIDHTSLDRRRATTRIEVTFANPIAGDLAKTLGVAPGRMLQLAGGRVEFDGKRLAITRS